MTIRCPSCGDNAIARCQCGADLSGVFVPDIARATAGKLIFNTVNACDHNAPRNQVCLFCCEIAASIIGVGH